jgi:hypothetical protein
MLHYQSDVFIIVVNTLNAYINAVLCIENGGTKILRLGLLKL